LGKDLYGDAAKLHLAGQSWHKIVATNKQYVQLPRDDKPKLWAWFARRMYKLENDSSKDGEEAALADEFWTTGIIGVTEGPESSSSTATVSSASVRDNCQPSCKA
jgi:hypothetical protein